MFTLMNQPAKRLSKEEQKLQILENQRQNEITHNLVVKIIIWKSGKLDGTNLLSTNKITPKEWSTYKKHMLEISKIDSIEKVKAKLEETRQDIKTNGGFK